MPFSWQPWGAGSSITGLPSLAEAEPPLLFMAASNFRGLAPLRLRRPPAFGGEPTARILGGIRAFGSRGYDFDFVSIGRAGRSVLYTSFRQRSGGVSTSKAVRHLSPDQAGQNESGFAGKADEKPITLISIAYRLWRMRAICRGSRIHKFGSWTGRRVVPK